MILSIDEVNDILDAAVEAYPEELFQELNGGILLLEDEVADPEAGEDIYIMGEYCWDEMGRYINLYYGSFAAVLSDESRQVWEEELRFTLRHELTHHVEGLAGERSLEPQASPNCPQRISWRPSAGGRTGPRKGRNSPCGTGREMV